MSEPLIAASYARAMARRGVPVTLSRLTGFAPHVQRASADVKAIVQGYAPTGGEDYAGPGEITRGTRRAIVLEADLRRAGFPLPVGKNDKFTLDGEDLEIVDADAETRRAAGAICLDIRGVE